MEGDVVTLQNLIVFEITGEDAQRHASSAATARPASPARASGIAPSITARRAGSPRRWPPPRCSTTTAIRSETAMSETDLCRLAAAMLAALAVGALAYVFLLSLFLRRPARATRACRSVTEPKGARRASSALEQAASRRKSVADTLKDLENRQKAAEKVTLRLRLERAGLDITPRASTGSRASLAASMLALHRHDAAAAERDAHRCCRWSSAFVGAFGLPRWFVNKLTQRRQTKFTRRARQRHRHHRARRQVGPAAERVPWRSSRARAPSRWPASSARSSSSSASACRWAKRSSA